MNRNLNIRYFSIFTRSKDKLYYAAKVALAGIALLFLPKAIAHQPGNSSLVLVSNTDNTIRGEYHVADVDMESINLMLEDSFLRSKPAIQNVNFDIQTQVVKSLPFIQLLVDDQPLKFETGELLRVMTDGDLHTLIPFSTGPLTGDKLLVKLTSFFQFDPQHQMVVSLRKAEETEVGILTLDDPAWTVSLKEPGPWQQFLRFTQEGVWHIWIGIDHILFLVALLLPSVLRFKQGKWHPASSFKEAFFNVIKVVTAFMVAHSITLTLAALNIVTLPSRLVESVIALSVVLAALNNIFPVVSHRVWTVAFGFGLIHGFGFANVLANLQLPTNTLAVALFSFNIGVEIGQLAIVAVFFPIIFLIREQAFYQPIKLRLGSAVISLIACGWIVDRVFQLEFMPF